ncbi:MAG TPA: hypothetical protein VLC09_07130 [Polyangiaceae bacterium]|nr:hypothetical protein [Polyangiaceae bacterium]
MALAQTMEGVDAVALPAPIAPSRFSSLEASTPAREGELSSSVRLGALGQPVVLGVPGPSLDGGTSPAVAGLLLLELTAAYGLPHGFDVGLGLGLHAYQWGAGTSALDGSSSLDPVAFTDPRLAIGWARTFGDFSVRPYAQLFVPFGDPAAFSGEGAVRGDLGIAASHRFDFMWLALDLGVRLREERTLGATRLGTQLRAGLGALVSIGEHLGVGPELVVQPNLASQAAPLDGEAGSLVPAQLRGTLRYELGTSIVLLSAGSGLPFSRSSSLTGSQAVRGLTSPTWLAMAELRTHF